jgi:hypothetical protein
MCAYRRLAQFPRHQEFGDLSRRFFSGRATNVEMNLDAADKNVRATEKQGGRSIRMLTRLEVVQARN